MSKDAFLKIEPSENSLQAVHKQWALWALRRLRFLHPELTLTLYGRDWDFTIHVANCEDSAFPALAEYFDNSVRPATCNIRLSRQAPQVAPIEDADNYEAELWLNGEPLSTPGFNNLLSLAEPTLPDGGIDFDHDRDTWLFRSFTSLTDDEKACVQKATTKVGIIGPVNFVEVSPPDTPPAPASKPAPKRQGDLTLITSRHLPRAPGTLRDLVHQDEDEWRNFLSRRAKQEIVELDQASTSDFACLYDVEHCGESRLSELLTIYDRVDVMPERDSLKWSTKHQVSLPDLQELVRLKRIRIILPYSVTNYPSTLLEAIAEVDRSAIVLSRALAAKTISRGQMKEPLLYAPLTSGQRAAVLSAMSRSVSDEKFHALLSSYGEMFSGQHNMFMLCGALASLNFGVGSYIGKVFFKLANKDARLELATCGAGMDWALGLGASYIPRDFGGYDETWNSQIIASYLGRTRPKPLDPTANRMHIISDGLLAVSNVPPLEVAKNFHSLPISRFRNLARRLMETSPSALELQEAVNQINADVKAFEHRIDRLASWKIQTLLEKGSLGYIGHEWGWWTSAAAAWLCEMLKNKIPETVKSELADAMTMLIGLATGSSLDAVVVSRSRKTIAKN